MEAMAGHSDALLPQRCDGTVDMASKGTWKGHVLPGSIFMLWGAWWAVNVLYRYLVSAPQAPYRSRSWYPFPWGRWARYLEPALKVLLPPLAVSVELYFDHDQYRYLYCPPGSQFGGRFAEDHLNNWAHAANYPAFVLAGVVDFLALVLPFPPGTSQAFLGVAFSVMAFLMGTHTKHEPLDAMVHWLLFLSMLLCVAAIALELARPDRPLVGAGKAAATILQGGWLAQLGRIEFETHAQWQKGYMGSLMLAPVAFAMIGVAVIASMLALYTLLAALKEAGLLPATLLPYGEPRHQLVGTDDLPFHCDSAHGSDDGSPRRKAFSSFQIGTNA